MSVLDAINAQRQLDTEERKTIVSLGKVKTSAHYQRECFSLRNALQDAGEVPVIAEHKTASPSEGAYACPSSLSEIVLGYETAGASALSILTEPHRFGGSLDHLRQARTLTNLPLLRKDFIVDPYQVHEAKSAGADAILLIAAGLRKSSAAELANLAHDIGLQVLLELHDETELEYLTIKPDVVGVNNRNLKTLKIDLQSSIDLYGQLPKSTTKISESGIKSPQDAARMLSHGYDGLLVGTQFMKTTTPGQTCQSFIEDTESILRNQTSQA